MKTRNTIIGVLTLTVLFVIGTLMAQQQTSGGGSVTVVGALPTGANTIGNVGITGAIPTGANTIGNVGINSALPTGGNAIGTVALNAAIPTGANAIGTVAINAALPAGANSIGTVVNGPGSNIIGFVRIIPSGCSAQSTAAQFTAAQVATGAGTSLTATTSCVVSCYANNITNAAVTLRLADKAGTPVIWVGGAADFSVPANSNMRVPMAEGIVFTSGITAIAGTATAINIGCSTYQ